MPPIFKVSSFAFALSLSLSSSAQNICAPYLDKTVQPLEANALWQQLAKVPNAKDEFETTPQFEARVASAIGGLNGPIIVEVPIQREFITYDADARRLDVQRYAFSNGLTEYSGVFGYGTPFYGQIQYGRDNLNVVLPYEEKQMGSYTGTNAMGAKIEIAKVSRLTRVIFERQGRPGENLFTGETQKDLASLSFSEITPEQAKNAKATARAAIVYIPRAPYFARGKYPWGQPTIHNPRAIDETIEVAIGDIQCALFLNSAGKVFGVIATR